MLGIWGNFQFVQSVESLQFLKPKKINVLLLFLKVSEYPALVKPRTGHDTIYGGAVNRQNGIDFMESKKEKVHVWAVE